MQFYIAIDGKEDGPFNDYRVTEMLREEKVTRDSLGWHQGRERWTPLHEIPALQSALESMDRAMDRERDLEQEGGQEPGLEKGDPSGEASPPLKEKKKAEPAAIDRKAVLDPRSRPFVRFWARTFDYMMVWMVVWMFFDMPEIPEGVSFWEAVRDQEQYFDQEQMVWAATVQLIAFAGWHVLEGLLIHLFGATPGKAIFGIRISRADGAPVGLWSGLGRSFYVWLAGFGLGIFPFTIIAMTLALFRLLSAGMTIWDRHLRLQVQHAPIGPGRILLAVAVFFLLMALRSLKVS